MDTTRNTPAWGEVVRTAPGQHQPLAALATRAFLDDDIYTYMLPDARERELCLGRYMDAFFGFARHYGEIYTVPGLAGVACWLSPWRSKPVLWQVLRTGFALPRATMAFPKQARERMVALAGYLGKVHGQAVQGRHWQMAVLAVDPAQRRQGLGGRLMQPMLARADAENLPCYLDTQTESNVRLYERHGFVVVSEGDVPGHPMRIWAMVRQPRR
ncbi:MAG: GNAT family N-acetyltransferase [Chloroflexota bacterium]